MIHALSGRYRALRQRNPVMAKAALVVAVLALFVALGGSAAAVNGFINGGKIKPGTIGGNKLSKGLNKRINTKVPGPPGPQGIPGPQGLTGQNGQNGDQGPGGPKGDPGLNGKDGTDGAKGDPGADGADGADGAKGDQGPPGPKGEKGDKGDKGDTGAQGVAGQNGQNGAQGPEGKEGKEGPKGEKGDPGPAGPPGPEGPEGPPGPEGEVEAGGKYWHVLHRNTIGSSIWLDTGPFFGAFGVTGESASPPFGNGSLNISVTEDATSSSPPSEKAAFGNEVEFNENRLLGLNEVGFYVVQTGENFGISPENMPNITFEIDPNLESTASGYSSFVWVPDEAPTVNEWSGYIDATLTGFWYLTGSAGSATGCTLGAQCSFFEAMAALADGGEVPTIHTLAIGKGRDNRWSGAVDGLTIGGLKDKEGASKPATVYDFEPYPIRVVEHPVP